MNNIFNIVLSTLRNSFDLLQKFANLISNLISTILGPFFKFLDFFIEVFVNGIANIIEFISSIFGG